MAVEIGESAPDWTIKFLSGWNALMITACCKAFSALGELKYRDLAVENMPFLEDKMRGKEFFISITAIKRSMGVWEYGSMGVRERRLFRPFWMIMPILIEAYIQLQEITGDVSYLIRAKELADWVIDNFSEEETGYFYYTHSAQDDVIVRKREVYDGATAIGQFGYGCKFVISGNCI